MDREDAIKATREGAIAACISGGLTTLVYLVAVLSKADSESLLGYYNDHTILFDIGLIFVLAWFIYKKSRVAAVTMFLYFIFAKVYTAIETGEFSGGILALVFLFYFGRAVWGAFCYHRIEKAENPDYKKGKKWVWFILTPIVVVFGLLLGLGVMTMTGFAPPTEIRSGQELHQNHVEKLVAKGVVSSRNEIEYFYSSGISSVLEGGVVLTDDRLIVYEEDNSNEEEVLIYQMPLEEVTKIEMTQKGDFWTDEIYLVSSDDPELWMKISLSVENSGHEAFIKALKAKSVDKVKD